MKHVADHLRNPELTCGIKHVPQAQVQELAADVKRGTALKRTTRLHAAGYADAAYQQGEFFSLHHEGGGAWPDQTMDPETDGIVSAFCIQDILTGVTDGQQPALAPSILPRQMVNGAR